AEAGVAEAVVPPARLDCATCRINHVAQYRCSSPAMPRLAPPDVYTEALESAAVSGVVPPPRAPCLPATTCRVRRPHISPAPPGIDSRPRACGSQRRRSLLRNQGARDKSGNTQPYLNDLFLIIAARDMNIVGRQNQGLIADRR